MKYFISCRDFYYAVVYSTVPVGLLDSSGGGGGLPCGLGSQLLPRGLSSGGLASGLLGASHVDLSEGISDFWKYVSLKFRF